MTCSQVTAPLYKATTACQYFHFEDIFFSIIPPFRPIPMVTYLKLLGNAYIPGHPVACGKINESTSCSPLGGGRVCGLVAMGSHLETLDCDFMGRRRLFVVWVLGLALVPKRPPRVKFGQYPVNDVHDISINGWGDITSQHGRDRGQRGNQMSKQLTQDRHMSRYRLGDAAIFETILEVADIITPFGTTPKISAAFAAFPHHCTKHGRQRVNCHVGVQELFLTPCSCAQSQCLGHIFFRGTRPCRGLPLLTDYPSTVFRTPLFGASDRRWWS